MGIKTTVAMVAIGIAVGACGGGSPDATNTALSSPAGSPSDTVASSSSVESIATPTAVDCPNPEGGVCLGPIAAGGVDNAKQQSPDAGPRELAGWQTIAAAIGIVGIAPGRITAVADAGHRRLCGLRVLVCQFVPFEQLRV